MPQEPPIPTDPDREAALSRLALWLDPGDLPFRRGAQPRSYLGE